jgi:hypothetical protein
VSDETKPVRAGWRTRGPEERDAAFLRWCDSIPLGGPPCEEDCNVHVCPAWRWFVTGEGTPPQDALYEAETLGAMDASPIRLEQETT